MADYLIQDTTLDAIADAINAKTGGSSAMTPAEMVTAIGTISGGGTENYVEFITTKTYSHSSNFCDDVAASTGYNSFVAYLPTARTDEGYQFCGAMHVLLPCSGGATYNNATFRWTSANAYGTLEGLQNITISPPVGTTFRVVPINSN